MANKVLERTLNNVDKEDMQTGWAAPTGLDAQQLNYSGPTSGTSQVMTAGGSARAALVLFALIVASGTWAWTSVSDSQVTAALWGGIIVALIFGLITTFKPKFARITAPLYAIAEGTALGTISRLFEDAYKGIVIQALLATAAIVFVMYSLYSFGFIKVTDKFRKIVIGATLGIFAFYFLSFILGMFTDSIPLINDSGPAGIIFSAVVIVIAAMNLALDFDFIERGSQAGLPKYMNWAAAYGLAVTVVWIYLEVLRLLMKSRN